MVPAMKKTINLVTKHWNSLYFEDGKQSIYKSVKLIFLLILKNKDYNEDILLDKSFSTITYR